MRTKAIYFYLFLVIQLYFFRVYFIPSNVAKGLALMTLFVAVPSSKEKERYFNKPFIGLLVCCMVNMVWCSFNRDQTPWEYVIGNEFTSMLGLLVFFAIPFFKMHHDEVEDVLTAVSLTCIGIYLVQYFFHASLIVSEETMEDQGLLLRARINGQCAFYYVFLKHLFSALESPTIKDIMLILLSLLCIVILGFRSHIFALFLVTALLVWNRGKLRGKRLFSFISIIVALSLIIQTDVVQLKIDQMLEREEEQNFENEDYVRYRSYDYYTTVAPENNIDKIIGIGLPNGNSTYGKQIQELKDYHIIWADWGLIGLSWVLGIPAVLCIVWYALKAFFTPVKPEKSYLCYWFLFMILCSIVTREIYRIGAFPIQGVILYLIAKYRTGEAQLSFKQLWKRK